MIGLSSTRPFSLIRTRDQWLRASHARTAVLGESVQLAWIKDPSPDPNPRDSAPPAGLAFDAHCRLFRSVTAEGRVERRLWAAEDALHPATDDTGPIDVFAQGIALSVGDFALSKSSGSVLRQPQGLAVDAEDRLFIAETGARRILIYDLWSRRLVRRVVLDATPVDLAADGRTIYALLQDPAGIISLEARSGLMPLVWPPALDQPSRLAVAPNRVLYVLVNARTRLAAICRYDKGGSTAKIVDVPFASDIEFQIADAPLLLACRQEQSVLVVARRPGEDFLRFCIGDGKPADLPPLKARDYDGAGIVQTPDGRIGFWTAQGFRHAVAARLRYRDQGRVITFQLDSGEFQMVWGRLFFDACIPRETQITVRCITTDDVPDESSIPRLRPENTEEFPTDEPPMPPQSLVDQLALQRAQDLHRRATGRELPWSREAEDDPFETYEAPILAMPGRYLWLQFDLRGNTRVTPRLRAVRAEYPSHDYLRRIPKTFSREPETASFLQRYLAMFEGFLGELGTKADTRSTLLDPRSAPAETLPWLAGFLGLTLDERMARAPQPGGKVRDVRRQLIREATALFRFRGTVWGLTRFLEIYLGLAPILIEKFRVRGLGGALLGDPSAPIGNSVLGAGFRIGGAIGSRESQLIEGTLEDAFKTHAHRFSVIIPALLTEEQHGVVQNILDVHRPAHTLVEICTVHAGMRVGRGLHVGLTSIIGRTGGFHTFRTGRSFLGRGTIIGRPDAGTFPGSGRVGLDTRVG